MLVFHAVIICIEIVIIQRALKSISMQFVGGSGKTRQFKETKLK
jgi:nitrogen fixation protein FixH